MNWGNIKNKEFDKIMSQYNAAINTDEDED